MSATSSFIWYELMTRRRHGGREVLWRGVGWTIADRADPQSKRHGFTA